jgi:DNA-binding transcriptional MerR regulator
MTRHHEIQNQAKKRKLTARQVCERYSGVTVRTIDRWLERGLLPQPMKINNVRYWDEDDLTAADQARMAAQRNEVAA